MPEQYIDKINIPGGVIVNLRDTVSELKDVNVTSLASGQSLVFNGSSWVNQSVNIPLMSTVQMQVTFTDQTTATYNVYIQPSV